jgi:hypothetical protein
MSENRANTVTTPAARGRFISKRDISIEIFEQPDGRIAVFSTFLDPYHLIRLDLSVEPGTCVPWSRGVLTNPQLLLTAGRTRVSGLLRSRSSVGRTLLSGLFQHIPRPGHRPWLVSGSDAG